MVKNYSTLLSRVAQVQKFQRCLKKKLSSVNTATKTTKTRTDDPRPDFISQVQNPEKHSINNLGEYYTVPGQTVSSLFAHGIPKTSFLDEVKTIGGFNIMIRESATSILEKMKSDESNVQKFVIYGQDGCGKTMTLSHILHYCFNKQWCILLLPSVFKLLHSKHSILPSLYNPKRFDQPDEALLWLRTFQSLNEKHLSEIKTTKEYKVGQKISIESGKPITTVINQAFHRPNFATDAVGITIKEVQQLSGKFPVLFAADEFNGLFWTSLLKNPETNDWLKPQDLSIVHYFEKLFKPGTCLRRGSYVMALSRTGMERSSCSSYNHMQLLRQKGTSCVGSYEPVEVSEYDDQEFMQCLKYYQHKGLLSKVLDTWMTSQRGKYKKVAH